MLPGSCWKQREHAHCVCCQMHLTCLTGKCWAEQNCWLSGRGLQFNLVILQSALHVHFNPGTSIAKWIFLAWILRCSSEVVLRGCVILRVSPDAAACALHATFLNDFWDIIYRALRQDFTRKLSRVRFRHGINCTISCMTSCLQTLYWNGVEWEWMNPPSI